MENNKSKEEPKQEWSKSNGDIVSDYSIAQSKALQKCMQLDAEMAYRFLPKQETLEEAAKEFFRKFKHTHSPDNYYLALVEFAKWQQERSYSEEDILINIELAMIQGLTLGEYRDLLIEQFKKK